MEEKIKKPIDPGTRERAKHNRLRPEFTGRGYEFRVRVSDQTAADRLLMNEDITATQFSVLDKFSEDLYRAGWINLRAQSYEPTTSQGSGENLSENEAVKKLTVAQAIKRLDNKVGPQIRGILLRVAMDELDPKGDQIRLLHVGIEILEDFYF